MSGVFANALWALALRRMSPDLVGWLLRHGPPPSLLPGGKTALTLLMTVFARHLGRSFRRRRRQGRRDFFRRRHSLDSRAGSRLLACLALLLDHGVDPVVRDGQGCTVFSHLAGRRRMVWKKGEGESVEAGVVVFENASHDAAGGYPFPVRVALVRRVSAWDGKHNTWLEINTGLLDWLAQRGIHPDWENLPLVATDGTCLPPKDAQHILPFVFAMNNQWERTRDKGVDRTVHARSGWTLLHEACGGVHPSPVEAGRLLQEGYSIDDAGYPADGRFAPTTPAMLMVRTMEKNPGLEGSFRSLLERFTLAGILPDAPRGSRPSRL
jgi:hypothetical protein